MEIALLEGKSKRDIRLFAEMAKKMGLIIRLLSEDEKEEIGLLNAMKQGKTGKYVDNESFLKKLRK